MIFKVIEVTETQLTTHLVKATGPFKALTCAKQKGFAQAATHGFTVNPVLPDEEIELPLTTQHIKLTGAQWDQVYGLVDGDMYLGLITRKAVGQAVGQPS